MARRIRPASYEDILRLPEHVVGEIFDGDLVVSPRPAIPHASATTGLGSDLYGPFRRGRGGPGGWWILFEPELHIGADIAVPDLAGWRCERLPVLPQSAWFDLPPDWLCETLSPRTARLDRTVKLPRYARWGVRHVWLLDPGARTLEVFRLEGERWVLAGTFGDGPVRAEPFDAVELDLSALWIEDVGGPPPAPAI
jgi:Uma2 family endonuclease